jgi:beta-lactamase regulating signal transducer with metallopeptidase domain
VSTGSNPSPPWLAAPASPIRRDAVDAASTTLTGVDRLAVADVWLAGLWLAGSALSVLWLLAAAARLRSLRRSADPVTESPALDALREVCDDAGAGAPALSMSPFVRVPLLTGIWRPAILLPEAVVAASDPVALRMILRHEVAHATRRDLAWAVAGRLALAACWFSPLLYVLARRLEHAAEEACDLDVLATGYAPQAYAKLLVDEADRLVSSAQERAAAVGLAPFRSGLGRRIQGILAFAGRPVRRMPRAARLAIGLGSLVAAVAATATLSADRAPMHVAELLGEVSSGSGTIVGRAVDAGGRPLPGAAVIAYRTPGNL